MIKYVALPSIILALACTLVDAKAEKLVINSKRSGT
jgi:hypothetical protein